jgi:hypothetical protein
LAEGLHDWGMRAVPLFSYTLAFALQLRKSTENLSQGSWRENVAGYIGVQWTGLTNEERVTIGEEVGQWQMWGCP